MFLFCSSTPAMSARTYAHAPTPTPPMTVAAPTITPMTATTDWSNRGRWLDTAGPLGSRGRGVALFGSRRLVVGRDGLLVHMHTGKHNPSDEKFKCADHGWPAPRSLEVIKPVAGDPSPPLGPAAQLARQRDSLSSFRVRPLIVARSARRPQPGARMACIERVVLPPGSAGVRERSSALRRRERVRRPRLNPPRDAPRGE